MNANSQANKREFPSLSPQERIIFSSSPSPLGHTPTRISAENKGVVPAKAESRGEGLFFPVLSCEEIRELDRRAQEEFGISTETLMENAGKAVAEEAIKYLEKSEIKKPWKIAIFCGGGNNGGDGMVAARLLMEKGCEVSIIFLKPPQTFKGEVYSNFQKIIQMDIPCLEPKFFEEFCRGGALSPPDRTKRATTEGRPYTANKFSANPEDCKSIKDFCIIIDAILGTGFRGKLKEPIKTVIEKINCSFKPIIAVDIPSGLDADTGLVQGSCVRANITVTMGAMKKGFLNKNSEEWTGKIVVADIGYPRELITALRREQKW